MAALQRQVRHHSRRTESRRVCRPGKLRRAGSHVQRAKGSNHRCHFRRQAVGHGDVILFAIGYKHRTRRFEQRSLYCAYTSEAYQNECFMYLRHFLTNFNQVWWQNVMPEEWKHAHTFSCRNLRYSTVCLGFKPMWCAADLIDDTDCHTGIKRVLVINECKASKITTVYH